MKYLLIYLAIGVYRALTFYRKGTIKIEKPLTTKGLATFLSDNIVVMILWPLSILLHVAMRKPDAMQFHNCKIDNKTLRLRYAENEIKIEITDTQTF